MTTRSPLRAVSRLRHPRLCSSRSPSSRDGPSFSSPLRAPARDVRARPAPRARSGARFRARTTSPFDAALAPAPSGHTTVPELERIEREVTLGADNGVRPPLPAATHAAPDRRRAAAPPAAASTSMRTRLPRGARSATRRGSSSGRTASRRATVSGRAPPRVAPARRRRRWRRSDGSSPRCRSTRRGSSTRSSAPSSASARARARPARPARRRARPARGLSRAREDADRALVRAGDAASASTGSSSRPT